MSSVPKSDGAANGEERRAFGPFVLGMSALSEMSSDGGDRLKVNHLKWTILFGVMVIAPPASAMTFQGPQDQLVGRYRVLSRGATIGDQASILAFIEERF